MRSVVLLKQVPATPPTAMNADFTMDRRQTQKITNPADTSALNFALDVKKKSSGEVFALTMGPASAVDCLREAALSGIDGAYHVCDRNLAGADTFVTALSLKAAIERIGSVDLIFCGNQTVDGETGQVGAEIAAMMGWACLTQIIEIRSLEEDRLCCSSMRGSDTEVYWVRRPAVLCICACNSGAVLPSLTALRRANSMPVQTWTLMDLEMTGIRGTQSSPTRVSAVRRKEYGRRQTEWLNQSNLPRIMEVICKERAPQE